MDDEPAWPRPAGRGPVVALGKLVADHVLELSGPLVAGGQQRVARTTSAGGAPANVTATLARLGVPSRVAGWAGADADGLLAGLAARGAEIAVVRRGRTPVSTVLVHPDGERTLLSDGGEGGLEPDDVRAEWVIDAAVLHVDGYDLLRYPASLRTAVARARDAGVPVSTWEAPDEPLEPRDTTGCGDAFAAGVLAGWRSGAPVLDAVRAGHAAAAVVAGVIGAQPPEEQDG